MTEIFNTSFELSLRVLIILNVTCAKLSIDRISALDFITTYGKDFGVSEYNLQGNNDYRFSEYASKRKIILCAVKNLVLMGYIIPHCNKSGFTYSVSKKGVLLWQSLNDEYAEKYAVISQKAYNIYSSYSDRKITRTINDYAVLRIGDKNDELLY